MITLEHASEITKSNIDELRPEFKEKVLKWVDALLSMNITPYIYEGYRTPERQQELYDQGRGNPGRIVTNARPWQSFHQYRLAIDWVPLKPYLKVKGMYEADWTNDSVYNQSREIAEPLGLKALSWEQPHLQDARYESWSYIPKD